MDAQERAKYRAKADIVRALAHPTRLFIIEKLARQERCVCELTQMVGADTSTVSKHLSVLKNAGILSDEKRGAMVFYRLQTPFVLEFHRCIERVLSERLRKQHALAS